MATHRHASDRMRQREVFHPKRISTAEERLVRAEVADRGVHATWASRVLVAHATVSELVEAYGGRDMEIDWFYTDQYNGHNSYHAAAECLVQWNVVDQLKIKLHALCFGTMWEAYDPGGNAASAAWRGAFTFADSIPPRARPWGMISYFDAGPVPTRGQWGK